MYLNLILYLCILSRLNKRNDYKPFLSYLQTSSRSLNMLVRAVLLDKKPEEVPMVRANPAADVICIVQYSNFLIELAWYYSYLRLKFFCLRVIITLCLTILIAFLTS